MADPLQLSLIQQGVDCWNEGREKSGWLEPDLSYSKLAGKDLSGANLAGADLTEATLTGSILNKTILTNANLFAADLSRTSIIGAHLVGADLLEVNLEHSQCIMTNFNGARLEGANLRWANLYGGSLIGANLTETMLALANLSACELVGADLTRAGLSDTVFGNTNLTNAQGLELCDYKSPSILDHRTLARSGALPLAFLRGCGLPETLITYLPSILGQPIEFYSCFISYSTKDQDFVERLHSDLQNKGVRCWFAPHSIKGGRKLHEQIDEAIRVYDRLLLILSEASMGSEWVKTEIAHARQKEIAQECQVLFPISLVPFKAIREWKCFDADTGKDSAREIREYFIPDFSGWKDHDDYQVALSRLLKDLKAERQVQAPSEDQ